MSICFRVAISTQSAPCSPDDGKLDLVNRLQWEGRDKIGLYFTRYAEETKWRFALGAVEVTAGHAGLRQHRPDGKTCAFCPGRLVAKPDHRDQDFLFAPYVLEAIDWVQ